MRSFLRRRGKQIGLVALASMSVGCGDGSSANAAAPGTSDSRTVRSRDPGAWSAEQHWRLRKETRIGSADSNGPDLFGRIVDVALDSEGRVWVADERAAQIRVFDARGQHVRSFGRKGGGPAEFGQIAGMDWDPDGNLWVLDAGNSRFAVYDTAGALITTHPRNTGVSMVPWPGGFDADGRLHDIGAIPGQAGDAAFGLVRYDRSLQPTDTFRVPPFEGEYFEVTTNGGRNRDRVMVPFTADQIWRIDPEGNPWTARTGSYQLLRHGYAGDTARVVELDRKPERVTRADLDRMRESYRWFTEKGGELDGARIPSRKPAFDGFFFDEEGFLWVIPVEAGEAGGSFNIFDPRGRYLGRIPSVGSIDAVPSPVVRGGRMAAVSTDDSGVPFVLLMRLEKPASR